MQETQVVAESNELDHSEASKYRRLAAAVNYVSMDRPDVQIAASVLGRPIVQSIVALNECTVFAETPVHAVRIFADDDRKTNSILLAH